MPPRPPSPKTVDPETGEGAGDNTAPEDGRNIPEVPGETPKKKPTGPVWTVVDKWGDTYPGGKHYAERSFKGQTSNCRFGKAREDVMAYANRCNIYVDKHEEVFRMPFVDMSHFIQT